jgi:general secretion pathway protein I
VSASSALSTRFPSGWRSSGESRFSRRTFPSSQRLNQHQGGFSLLEVVVAFSILALSLGILIQIFSRALSTTALSRDYSRAATLAEARLNDVGIDIPLETGSYSGEPEDGFSWQLTIAPYTGGDLAWEPSFDAFLVTSVVSWQAGSGTLRRISLSTLRIGEPSGLPGLTPEGEPERKSLGPDVKKG